MSEPPPPDPRQPDAGRYRDRIEVSDPDDDFEYEVEPVDEELIAREKARARQEVIKAEAAVDVDAVYRELDGRDQFDAAFEKFRAKFSLKSLLITMTVVAVVLGIGGSGLFNGTTFAGFIFVSLIGLGLAHAWLNFEERKRRAAVLARRDRQVRRAEHLANHPDVPYEEEDDEPDPAGNPFTEFVGSLTTVPRFSIAELMISTTVASFVLVLLMFAGNSLRAAVALGFVTVAGFALQAADVQVPRPLILAWWLTLFGFCLLMLGSGMLGVAGFALGGGGG